jgi:hypothetical protein
MTTIDTVRVTNTLKTVNDLATMIWGNDYGLAVDLQIYNKSGNVMGSAHNLFRLNRTGGGWLKAKAQVSALLEICEMIQPKGYILGTVNSRN